MLISCGETYKVIDNAGSAMKRFSTIVVTL